MSISRTHPNTYTNERIWKNVIIRQLIHKLFWRYVAIRNQITMLLTLLPWELIRNYHHIRLQIRSFGICWVVNQVTHWNRCRRILHLRAINNQPIVIPVFIIRFHFGQWKEVLLLYITNTSKIPHLQCVGVNKRFLESLSIHYLKESDPREKIQDEHVLSEIPHFQNWE